MKKLLALYVGLLIPCSLYADDKKPELVGQWKEIRGHYQDIFINDKLVIHPTPFGEAELNWHFPGERDRERHEHFKSGYYQANFKRKATCTTTYLYVIGSAAGTFDRDSDQSYYDEIHIALDPSGYLNMHVIDRRQNNDCGIESEVKNYVFRPLNETELAEIKRQRELQVAALKAAAEQRDRDTKFLTNVWHGEVATLETLYQQGITPAFLSSALDYAIRGDNRNVIEWLMPKVPPNADLDPIAVWNMKDQDLIEPLLSQFPRLNAKFALPQTVLNLARSQSHGNNRLANASLPEEVLERFSKFLDKAKRDYFSDLIPKESLENKFRTFGAASDYNELSLLAKFASDMTIHSEFLKIVLDRVGADSVDKTDTSGVTAWDYSVAAYYVFQDKCQSKAANPESLPEVKLKLDNAMRKFQLMRTKTDGTERKRTRSVGYLSRSTVCTWGKDQGVKFYWTFPAANLISPIDWR